MCNLRQHASLLWRCAQWVLWKQDIRARQCVDRISQILFLPEQWRAINIPRESPIQQIEDQRVYRCWAGKKTSGLVWCRIFNFPYAIQRCGQKVALTLQSGKKHIVAHRWLILYYSIHPEKDLKAIIVIQGVDETPILGLVRFIKPKEKTHKSPKEGLMSTGALTCSNTHNMLYNIYSFF